MPYSQPIPNYFSWPGPELLAGTYLLSATWQPPEGGAGAADPAAPIEVRAGGAVIATLAADQTRAPAGAEYGGWAFEPLGTFAIGADAGPIQIRIVFAPGFDGGTVGQYSADAIRIEPA